MSEYFLNNELWRLTDRQHFMCNNSETQKKKKKKASLI